MRYGIGIDFVPHSYTSDRTNIFFIILLSTFYAVKLSGLKISGHSSVVERLVANVIDKKLDFCKSVRFNNINKLSNIIL